MWQLLLKGLISGVLVVAATEVAKRSSVWGAVLVSLPLTSVLALTWLWIDTRDVAAVSELSWAILWIVLPSLVFFAVLPIALRLGAPFPLALVIATVVLAVAYASYVVVLRALGVE